MNTVWNPSDRQLRQFACLLPIFSLLFSGILYWKGAPAGAAVLVGTIGVALALLGYGVRWISKATYLTLMILAFPLGWVMNRILLGIAYFGVVTPIGALIRLRRDPLNRKWDPNAGTYWVPRRESRDLRRYFHPF